MSSPDQRLLWPFSGASGGCHVLHNQQPNSQTERLRGKRHALWKISESACFWKLTSKCALLNTGNITTLYNFDHISVITLLTCNSYTPYLIIPLAFPWLLANAHPKWEVRITLEGAVTARDEHWLGKTKSPFQTVAPLFETSNPSTDLEEGFDGFLAWCRLRIIGQW